MDIIYDYSDLNSNLFTLQYGENCPDHLKLMDQFLQRIAIYEDEQIAEQLIKQLAPLVILDIDVFGEPAAQTVVDIESSTYEIEDEEITLIYEAKTVTKTFLHGKKDSRSDIW